MESLTAKFQQVASTCTFFATRGQIDAHKLAKNHKTDLQTLAIFSYLLPHEILFEYQQTPENVHSTATPKTLLIFEFIKKYPPSIEIVRTRVDKFKLRLQQFVSRRSFEQLSEFAKIPQLPLELRLQENTLESVQEFLTEISTATRRVPARAAQYATGPVDATSAKVMERRGMSQLYTHQLEALDHLKHGHSVVVSTSTASGKSFIFQAAVISALEKDPDARAIFIYPTKALAQDQLQIFQGVCEFPCATFDGDTPMEKRQEIRESARVLFTNPDTLHLLLPHWAEWQDWLANLEFVVIDEVHTYKGMFGSHVAMILRRLRRLAGMLGSEIKFICCSATIQEPLRHVKTLIGIDAKLVDKDGSPMSQRFYYFIQSQTQDNKYRGHPLRTAAPLFVRLVECGQKVIAFCQYRKACELLMKAIRAETQSPEIMSYRGGYNPQDRRQIERDMFSNKLKGIVATSALEVGVDIGGLDCVVLCGFPSSLASFRQQIGRVGRRTTDSIVVFVAGGHVMDQSYISKPDRVFTDQDPDIDLKLEKSVVEAHLQCAAREAALDDDDLSLLTEGSGYHSIDGLVFEDGLYHCHMSWLPNPASQINVRNVEEAETAIIDITSDTPRILETIETSRVGFTVYPGGIYIHQGLSYLVKDLEEDLKYAKVERTSVQWHTRQRDFTDVDPLKETNFKSIAGHNCYAGLVKIKTVVFGYFKVDQRNRILEAHDLTLPPVERRSSGLWVNLPSSTLDVLSAKKLHAGAAIHSAQHAILNNLSHFVALGSSDTATECKAPQKELAKRLSSRQRPARLIFYQRQESQVWPRVLEYLEALVERACGICDSCSCDHGCSKCVGFSYCSEQNVIISKAGAQVVLRLMLGRNVDNVRDGPEEHLLAATEGTVVPVMTY